MPPSQTAPPQTPFTFDLRLPWEWWRASALLDLVHDGYGTWRSPTLDAVAIETSRLPPNLPHLGILQLTFITNVPDDAPPPMTLKLDLHLASHSEAAVQLDKVPRGSFTGGTITFRLGGVGPPRDRLPVPLPPSGWIAVGVTPPLPNEKEPPTLKPVVFESVMQEARRLSGGWCAMLRPPLVVAPAPPSSHLPCAVTRVMPCSPCLDSVPRVRVYATGTSRATSYALPPTPPPSPANKPSSYSSLPEMRPPCTSAVGDHRALPITRHRTSPHTTPRPP